MQIAQNVQERKCYLKDFFKKGIGMKKFVLIGLVIVLSKLSLAYGWVDPTRTEKWRTGTASLIVSNSIEQFVGKTIYRDVPVQNETEYDTAHQNIPYTIDSYNGDIVSLRDRDGKLIVLDRNLWDDGNWKEWKNSPESLVGKFIHRTKPRIIGTVNDPNRVDNSFMGEKMLLISVCRDSFTLSSNILTKYNFTLDRKTWDDGNWEECASSEYFPVAVKETSIKWYFGQEVWDVIKGRGIVVNTAVGGTDKIKIKFHENLFGNFSDMDDYTVGGKYNDKQAQRLFPVTTKSVIYDLDKLFPKKKEEEKLTQDNNDTNHICSDIYNKKYNLRKGDHVVWGKKCGIVLVFDMNNATVAYCRGKSSPFYCTARDEVECIGASNLTKSDKCFKYP